MAILVGVHPGGRNSFAVDALYWSGRLPAALILSKTFSGVQAALDEILGVAGEWGELTAAAIDAPLTWSGTPQGWRPCDEELKARVPNWAPRSWVRSPNALQGAVAVQGPALAWALAFEQKRGNLPKPEVFEAHSRLSLARSARDMKNSVLRYRSKDVAAATRAKHVASLVQRFVQAGVIKPEADLPANAEELDAMVCAMTALGAVAPDSGLVVHTLTGGELRPVGARPVALLEALP